MAVAKKSRKKSSSAKRISAEDWSRQFPECKTVVYEASETIFKEGSKAKMCLVIIKGKVQILKRTRKGEKVLLGVVKLGEFLGEMAMLSDKRRSASAIARTRVVANSLRATTRMTGVHRTTVMKLLADLGEACSKFQDEAFRNLSCKRIQCDEIWNFVGAKEVNIPREEKGQGRGDVWTWTAICPDTKLVPCWYIGNRDAEAAYHFMHDLAGRLASRVQMTTDGHKPYVRAVEDAFGEEIDYAQLIKIYGRSYNDNPAARYSPAQCMGARKGKISGKPDFAHVSTSICERNNLTMRMGMRRMTRLTNAFSKKVENLEHAVALHFMHYNFCRIHGSLRVTPAMEAGVSDHVWSLEEVIALLD